MSTLSSPQQAALDTIDAAADDLRTLSLAIHAQPELGYEETHAHAVLSEFLEGAGYDVERGAHGLATSFRAVFQSDSPAAGPVVAALCEYDALPALGHACGHNLIAAAGVAVGLGLRAALRNDGAAGTVVVLGTPAEERGGAGKARLIEAEAFAGIEAAVMVHPGMGDHVRGSSLAHRGLNVVFHGRASHAAGAPWLGVNALDAMISGFSALGLLRQQLRPTDRVHGVITHGGDSPNITPERTEAQFLVRAPVREEVDVLRERVLACFRGAAEQTGCELESTWAEYPYENLIQNPPLADAYAEHFEDLGGQILPPRLGGSTDMGNVSHVLPGLHPHFRIPAESGNHTRPFAAAAATPEAHDAMLRSAKALCLAALRIYTNADFRAEVRRTFSQPAPDGPST